MCAPPPDEQAALVALLRECPGRMSWAEITAEIVGAGSASEVWTAMVPPTLDSVEAPGPREAARRDIEEWTADRRLTLTTILDRAYPARLRGIHQAPPLLFSRGSLRADDRAVSVVGSRAASRRGLDIAAAVATELAARDITVLAGLAAGIDTAAHRAALGAGGRTVAVLGTGINRHYPPCSHALHEEIARRGLLVSQFWPDCPPRKQNFLLRNATISGYGRAAVVVEAGEHSGTRALAKMAVAHGRPVILTSLVLDQTRWANELRDRPGVHIAHSLWLLMDAVLDIIETDTRLDAELDRLTSR